MEDVVVAGLGVQDEDLVGVATVIDADHDVAVPGFEVLPELLAEALATAFGGYIELAGSIVGHRIHN